MWLWILSNIAGSLLGAATTSWISKTKAGKWMHEKCLDLCWEVNEKYGVDLLDKEEISWKTKYPTAASKLFELEQRISKLENEK